jgi:hypothetical protein
MGTEENGKASRPRRTTAVKKIRFGFLLPWLPGDGEQDQADHQAQVQGQQSRAAAE